MSKIKKIFPLTENKQAFQKAKISKESFVLHAESVLEYQWHQWIYNLKGSLESMPWPNT